MEFKGPQILVLAVYPVSDVTTLLSPYCASIETEHDKGCRETVKACCNSLSHSSYCRLVTTNVSFKKAAFNPQVVFMRCL